MSGADARAGYCIRGLSSMMINDQPGTAPSGDVGPDPLQEDAHSKVRLRQELEMNACPHEPREKSAHANLTGLQDGEPLPDHRHAALVEVAKRTQRRSAPETLSDQPSRIAAFLDRDLRHTGQGSSVLLERRGIADDEDLGMPRDREVLLDAYPSGPIRRNSERSVLRTNAPIAAASSTPVGPAPTSTNVSRSRWRLGSSSASACSKARSILFRIATASARLFSPGANRANSSCPK